MSVLHTTVIPMYPGFPTLDDLLQRIPQTAQTIAASFREFPRAVDALRRDPPEAQYVRVPLDVHRDSIRSLQWYPLTLADLVSSSNEDLLHIMEQCLAIQVHTRHVMPLLMDENIFYRLAKFIYSGTYNPFKLSEHYATLPMLYGCWHPYKYVCTMIHRKFFPILGYLGQQVPAVDEEIMCHPKLLHIEKQCCALLLATPNVEDRIVHKETSIMQFPEAFRKLPLVWLTGLKNPLHFYISAAFLLGNLVCDCNWDGRRAATGRTARKILELSFVLIVALTMDTDCNVPYVRTLCVALLCWLPWNDTVPGCCYAEEPLEAMLSRLGSRCRAYPQMKTFDQTLDLFLSMAPPKRGEKKTRGQIRSGLVAIMSSGLRRFLLAITTNRMVHVEWNSGKNAACTAVPEDLKFPGQPLDNGGVALYQRPLTRSLSTLTRAARPPTDEVSRLLRTIVPGRDPREHAGRDAQPQRVRDAAIAVADDDDEAPESAIVSDSSSHRSVGDLIVDVDTQDDEPPPVVLLQEMEEYEVVSLEDDSMDC